MLNARVMVIFIAAAILLALLSWVCNSDAETALRAGRDSYGMNYYGWHGMYTTLEKLTLPAARTSMPPSADDDIHSVRVFWEADERMVANEPVYGERLKQWVMRGGIAVIAPTRIFNSTEMRSRRQPGENALLKALLDDKVRPVVYDVMSPEERELELAYERGEYKIPERTTPPPPKDEEPEEPKERKTFSAIVSEYEQRAREYLKPREYTLTGSYTFKEIAAKVRTTVLPTNLQTLELGGRPHATLTAAADGRKFLLGADFIVGKGRVCVFAEPTLLYNGYLAKGNNAALAVYLLCCPFRTTVFDEFYHGHAARRSVFQLFASRPYALPAAAFLGLLALIAWRCGTAFGPPLAAAGTVRRSLLEYIGALTRLLNRGKTRNFVLQGLLRGVLWRCRHEFHLDPGKENIDDVAAYMARRDPERAARFAAAARRCEKLAAASESLGVRSALAAARRLLKV